ncbi:MAG TPA: hypothetical protein VGC63_04955 [Solirubrobacterales bacterium]
MKRKRKMSAAEKQRRRERRAARRRARVEKMGAARCHWERRRRGQTNIAPELKHRGVADEGLEDMIIGGRGVRMLRRGGLAA